MKVTAIIPDDLVKEVVEKTHAKNITESLKIALTEWLKIQKLKELNLMVSEKPLDFKYSAKTIRDKNRQ
ncbi:MAG: DUF2191 domain-containing protein [Candidatus Delongbacteria bacterium]|nr:DUF2191 domain-containing protein [Candidatus Delongbacteria bacterium]